MSQHPLRGVSRRARSLAAVPLIILAIIMSPLLSVVAQVTPQLVLSAASALPGTPVVATGSGFPAGGTGQLMWADGTPLAGFGIDGDGVFALELIVPEVAAGQYTLAAASDDGSSYAEAVISVEAPAEQVPPPAELPADDAVPTDPAAVEPTPLAPVDGWQVDPNLPWWWLTDADPSTVWSATLADAADTAEVGFDLGSVQPLERLTWLPTWPMAGQVEIRLSNDGATWYHLTTLDMGQQVPDQMADIPVGVQARFVNLVFSNPVGGGQVGAIAGLEAWAEPNGAVQPLEALTVIVPTPEPTEVPPTEEPAAATPEVAMSMAAAALPGDSMSLPLRAAFYYPWFPGAWDQRGVNPYTNFEPSRGYYDGGDPAVVSGHIADMQYGNIQVGISSWWGPGTREDARMPQLLSAASGTGFKWSVYYEDEGFGDPSVETLRADLEYLRDMYASDPSYLRIDGRFVVFVYGGGESCQTADRWAQANETVNAFIVLKVFGGYRDCASQPDSWHQYGPATAADSQGSYSYTISPGFHLYGEAERLPRDLARWQQDVRNMVASGADWQLVTTYNEWGEGTSVESATAWQSDSGYGQYLDVLHANGEGALPGAAKPEPTVAPTAAPTQAPTVAPTAEPTAPATTAMTLTPVADARVKLGSPSKNYGNETKIAADKDPEEMSFLRFDVQGLSGAPDKAVLRLWVTDATSDGPRLATVSSTTWSETGITWNTRPAHGAVIGDVGNASAGQWIEYDVTAAIAGNGPVSFALLGDSSNGIDIASREASADQRPQLVINGGGTSEPGTPTEPTPTATQAPSPEPTIAPTPISREPLTVSAVADTYISEAKPDTNYGAATRLQSDLSPNTQILLRFDVANVDGPVGKATLRLFVTNGTPDGPAVHASTDASWSESKVTWSTRPATGAQVADTGSVPPAKWLEYDVTSIVTGNGAYTFALVPQSTDGLYIDSKETGNAPQLVVTTGETGATDPTLPTPEPWVPTGETATLLAAGDIATCSNNGDEQTAQVLDGQPGTIAMLGDAVYEEGTLQQFQDCYEPTWGRHKDRTMPIPGNHEYKTAGASGYYDYFGPSAGVPGQGYYSYNLGDWHIVALNSEISMSAGSAQERWLRADLAANPAQCTLAYWHQPLFSSGKSHGNSPETRPLFQALYEHGAEIVLGGHDHTYERFAPQTPDGQADTEYGIREFVVGTGGRSVYSFGTIKPNSEARNNSSLGVLKLTLAPGGYSWEFLPVAGASYTDSGTGTCHDAPGSAASVGESEQASRVSGTSAEPAITGFDSRRQPIATGRRQAR